MLPCESSATALGLDSPVFMPEIVIAGDTSAVGASGSGYTVTLLAMPVLLVTQSPVPAVGVAVGVVELVEVAVIVGVEVRVAVAVTVGVAVAVRVGVAVAIGFAPTPSSLPDWEGHPVM